MSPARKGGVRVHAQRIMSSPPRGGRVSQNTGVHVCPSDRIKSSTTTSTASRPPAIERHCTAVGTRTLQRPRWEGDSVENSYRPNRKVIADVANVEDRPGSSAVRPHEASEKNVIQAAQPAGWRAMLGGP